MLYYYIYVLVWLCYCCVNVLQTSARWVCSLRSHGHPLSAIHLRPHEERLVGAS